MARDNSGGEPRLVIWVTGTDSGDLHRPRAVERERERESPDCLKRERERDQTIISWKKENKGEEVKNQTIVNFL